MNHNSDSHCNQTLFPQADVIHAEASTPPRNNSPEPRPHTQAPRTKGRHLASARVNLKAAEEASSPGAFTAALVERSLQPQHSAKFKAASEKTLRVAATDTVVQGLQHATTSLTGNRIRQTNPARQAKSAIAVAVVAAAAALGGASKRKLAELSGLNYRRIDEAVKQVQANGVDKALVHQVRKEHPFIKEATAELCVAYWIERTTPSSCQKHVRYIKVGGKGVA